MTKIINRITPLNLKHYNPSNISYIDEIIDNMIKLCYDGEISSITKIQNVISLAMTGIPFTNYYKRWKNRYTTCIAFHKVNRTALFYNAVQNIITLYCRKVLYDFLKYNKYKVRYRNAKIKFVYRYGG